jgi:hypothetical protein
MQKKRAVCFGALENKFRPEVYSQYEMFTDWRFKIMWNRVGKELLFF